MPARSTSADRAEEQRPRRGRPPRVSRDDVIVAAEELFARRGYRGTTLVAIAESIGVTDAALLRYFDSKAAILDAVLSVDDQAATEAFRRIMEPGGIRSLELLAAGGWEMGRQSPLTTRMQLMLTVEALSDGSELHGRFLDRYRFIRRTLVRSLKKGIEVGEIRADVDPAFEATAMLAFIDGVRMQWFFYEGDVPLDRYVTTYLEHVIDRIAVRRPTPRRRRS